jgi:hypothetical protein
VILRVSRPTRTGRGFERVLTSEALAFRPISAAIGAVGRALRQRQERQAELTRAFGRPLGATSEI